MGLIVGCAAYFLDIPLLYPLAFVLMTNMFDLLGYGQIMQPIYDADKMSLDKYAIESRIYKEVLPYYRIIQKLFIFQLANYVWILTDNWVIALACLCSNFGGFQDVLYYFFGRYNFNQDYTWLKWTPLGMLLGDLNKTEFIIQGIVSFGLIIILIWSLANLRLLT